MKKKPSTGLKLGSLHVRFERTTLDQVRRAVGGSDHRITNISAQLLPNESATMDCPALPGKMKPLSLSSNLWALAVF